MPKERFKLIPAVHLFLIRDGKILLLRRYNTGYEDGNYSVIAGHMDGGESVTHAMAREALEEADIRLNPKDLAVVHVMHRNANTDTGAQNERVDFFLTTDKWTGEPVITEPDKCDELAWFSTKELPTNVIPYVRFGIENYLNDIRFSEFGWP